MLVKKTYEFKNYLGHVVLTTTDRKFGIDANTSGELDYYVADITSETDYFPYGMAMPERKASIGDYRYAAFGFEQDQEVSGEGNSYTTYFRSYDPRLGRWKSPDPVIHPWESDYVGFADNPILYTDPSGDDVSAVVQQIGEFIEGATEVVVEVAKEAGEAIQDVAGGGDDGPVGTVYLREFEVVAEAPDNFIKPDFITLIDNTMTNVPGKIASDLNKRTAVNGGSDDFTGPLWNFIKEVESLIPSMTIIGRGGSGFTYRDHGGPPISVDWDVVSDLMFIDSKRGGLKTPPKTGKEFREMFNERGVAVEAAVNKASEIIEQGHDAQVVIQKTTSGDIKVEVEVVKGDKVQKIEISNPEFQQVHLIFETTNVVMGTVSKTEGREIIRSRKDSLDRENKIKQDVNKRKIGYD